jgi:hypothetical protein
MEDHPRIILGREDGNCPIALVQMGETIGENSKSGNLQFLGERFKWREAIGQLRNEGKLNRIAKIIDEYHGIHQGNASPFHFHIFGMFDEPIL